MLHVSVMLKILKIEANDLFRSSIGLFLLVHSLRNSDVKAIGKVGLSIDGDYFKTINYDILYEGTGAYLSVRKFLIKYCKTKLYNVIITIIITIIKWFYIFMNISFYNY